MDQGGVGCRMVGYGLLTSTLVMSQSLTALLCAPLVTIWKPLAVAV